MAFTALTFLVHSTYHLTVLSYGFVQTLGKSRLTAPTVFIFMYLEIASKRICSVPLLGTEVRLISLQLAHLLPLEIVNRSFYM